MQMEYGESIGHVIESTTPRDSLRAHGGGCKLQSLTDFYSFIVVFLSW